MTAAEGKLQNASGKMKDAGKKAAKNLQDEPEKDAREMISVWRRLRAKNRGKGVIRAQKQAKAGRKRKVCVSLAEGADARPHPENACARILMVKAPDPTEIKISTECLNLIFSIPHHRKLQPNVSAK
jgi:hypothetical protein